MHSKTFFKYTLPLLLAGGVFLGCDETTTIDESNPNYTEVVEDIAGNANGVPVTADQLNAIDGISGAIEGVDYATALAEGTYDDPSHPTVEEIQAVIDAANGPAPLPTNITIDISTLQKAIGSIIDTTPYPIDMQGKIDSSGLEVIVPYTVVNAPTTLPAYSTSVELDSSVTEDDETGIVATFAWKEQPNLPVGQGTFKATITIDDSSASIPDDTYNAKKLDIQDDIDGVEAARFRYAANDAGDEGNLTLTIYPGIPDRMFGTIDNTRNANNHKFLYLPVTNSETGKTWLNNNLGADYSNINSPVFNIAQQATASNDYKAYGSLFQWGRKADGHELINWINDVVGEGINSATSTHNDDPLHALFITDNMLPIDWRVNQNDTLWASESGENNVCPTGYRLPTYEELDFERQTWASSHSYPTPEDALASTLALTQAGYREAPYSSVNNYGPYGFYWTSTVSGEFVYFLWVNTDYARMNSDGYRAAGYTVRCIKD